MAATPISVLVSALIITLLGVGTAAWVASRQGRRKLTLARIDFASYVIGSGGILSLVPDTVKMLAPNLMTDSPEIFWTFSNFKYLAFFMVSFSIGLGAMRRWLSITIEK